MPAVELARLQTLFAGLVQKFDQGEAFRDALRLIFDRYAERTYRPGQNIQGSHLQSAYHVSALFMRQLELALSGPAQANPEAALELAEVLWNEPQVEPRQIAAYLLSRLPTGYLPEVTKRLREWAKPHEDRQALFALIATGGMQLRRYDNPGWLALIANWTSNPLPSVQSIGLYGVLSAVEDDQFNNFPPIYQMLSPLLQNASSSTQSLLLETLQGLARRTPQETAFFLRQLLSISPKSSFVRLVRKALPSFPAETREPLKAIVKTLQT